MPNKFRKGQSVHLDFSGSCLVMGVLNITPDSFSDGGDYLSLPAAVEKALEMETQGASIIDIGPQSTRPGSEKVSIQQQIERAIPVIEALAGKLNIPISIDSPDPEVVEAAIEAGAGIINDITAGSDPKMAEIIAQSGLPVVLMHMQGRPETMQNNPVYKDVVEDVFAYLHERADELIKRGVKAEKIILDPGIGFGKTTQHNLALLKHIDRFVNSEYPILVGASRKRFIGEITGKKEPKDRLFGTNAITSYCAARGVSVIRVHDIPPAVDTVKMIYAIESAR